MATKGSVPKVLRRLVLLSLPVLAAAVACTPAPNPSAAPSSAASGIKSGSGSVASPGTSSSSTAAPGRPVHVSLLESDGGRYGVGMPIIAWFNVAPTDATAFAAATAVKANGHAVEGAWYFEPTARAGSAVEGHYRPKTFWPAHSSIEMQLPVKGLSAGKGLVYDDSLSLSMSTGAAKISTVNAASLRMTVRTDNRIYGVFPVSLGAPNTRTLRGTKVIMEKGADISMRGPGYFDPHVQWTQRLTYGGEYLHSAPWNVANIGSRSTSNGCTNLLPADAKQLFGYLGIGDVVQYPDADGNEMQLGQGYGDWNLPWSRWLTGGAIRTH